MKNGERPYERMMVTDEAASALEDSKPKKAFELYKISARLGCMHSMLRLVELYGNGDDDIIDEKEHEFWMFLAG